MHLKVRLVGDASKTRGMPCRFLTSRSHRAPQSCSSASPECFRTFWLDMQSYPAVITVYIPLSSLLTLYHNLSCNRTAYGRANPKPTILIKNTHLCSVAASFSRVLETCWYSVFSTVRIPGDFPENNAKFLLSLTSLYTTVAGISWCLKWWADWNDLL